MMTVQKMPRVQIEKMRRDKERKKMYIEKRIFNKRKNKN